MTDPATIAKGLSEARDIPDELVERVIDAIMQVRANHKSTLEDTAQAAIRAVLDWQASSAIAGGE